MKMEVIYDEMFSCSDVPNLVREKVMTPTMLLWSEPCFVSCLWRVSDLPQCGIRAFVLKNTSISCDFVCSHSITLWQGRNFLGFHGFFFSLFFFFFLFLFKMFYPKSTFCVFSYLGGKDWPSHRHSHLVENAHFLRLARHTVQSPFIPHGGPEQVRCTRAHPVCSMRSWAGALFMNIHCKFG